MKIIAAIFLLFVADIAFAQTKYNHEFSVQTDNDAYLFGGSDRYYTNGVFLTCTNKNKAKQLQHFTLGQMIFTPLFLDLTSTALMDRPFCGYLFAEYGQTQFTKNNTVLKWYASAGTIGKTSLGKDFQEVFHDAIGLYDVSGWEYQVKETVALNAGITYMPLLLDTKNNFSFKVTPIIAANAGNVYANAQAGILLSAGFMHAVNESALLNAGINSSSNKPECFIYFQPQIIAQAYNATTQGSLLGNNGGAFSCQPTTFMYTQTIGLAYVSGRFTVRLELHNQSKECSTQLLDHQYGSLQFAYRSR